MTVVTFSYRNIAVKFKLVLSQFDHHQDRFFGVIYKTSLQMARFLIDNQEHMSRFPFPVRQARKDFSGNPFGTLAHYERH